MSKLKAKDLSILLFATVLIAVLGYVWFSPSGVKPTPTVSVTGLNGQVIDLAGYRGRPLLVTFWATSCPGCVKEIPHLIELHNELAAKGLEIVGIAMQYDPPNQVRELVNLRKVPYTIALDRDGSAALAFGDVKLTPTSFLIDPQGRIVQQRLGDLDMNDLRNRINGMLAQKG